ncbi:peptidyl-prolyl cis-trans isomerase B (cyclophilin B) [Sediminihabitans luteus]|uniref:Peptidyl-prolyl cis-trans isomerase B (Cyclophilin B) n=1 Tax=Sediminihabitans luteus TaxID=1138585 RepID=A0A2M9CQJ8_9CELL|nr:peptidylprolyl isomerase [Sediminihabitans luteus]PJJ74167.1 peptidyl-prolyl cis-trans isomerase B (cyclophilin B) [Sediminihabitans luteus]GII99020.1 peptidyl-prolyl cis-trans isomerase [Sediminihabitans luteus]
MTSKAQREREQARKRQLKWEQRQSARTARRRRAWSVGGAVAGLVVIGGLVVWAVQDDEPEPSAATTPPASATTQPDDAAQSATPLPSRPAPAAGEYTLPDPSVAEGREWTGTISTSAGDVGVSLDGAAAPKAVASFVTLAQDGYFDGTGCHRLTTSGIYVLQCGDPTATGTGGPGYTFGPIENAPADGVYPTGTIAMARASAPDSMGSQFFLVYEDTQLPTDGGGYTVFGTITSGLENIQAVADAGTVNGSGDGVPLIPVTIEGVEVQ